MQGSGVSVGPVCANPSNRTTCYLWYQGVDIPTRSSVLLLTGPPMTRFTNVGNEILSLTPTTNLVSNVTGLSCSPFRGVYPGFGDSVYVLCLPSGSYATRGNLTTYSISSHRTSLDLTFSSDLLSEVWDSAARVVLLTTVSAGNVSLQSWDPSPNSLVHSLALPGWNPVAVATDPTSGTIYVLNETQAGSSLLTIDASTLTVVASAPLSWNAGDAIFNPVQHDLLVRATSGTAYLWYYPGNRTTRAVDSPALGPGDGPTSVFDSAHGDLYFASYSGIVAMNATSGSIIGTVTIPPGAGSPIVPTWAVYDPITDSVSYGSALDFNLAVIHLSHAASTPSSPPSWYLMWLPLLLGVPAGVGAGSAYFWVIRRRTKSIR